MPRPQRPCAHTPGDHGDPTRCPNLTNHPSGRCTTHLAAQRAHTDANRPNAHRRGYNSAHRADRPADGTTCAQPGCTATASLHRDHIDGDPNHNDPTNIQWLCARHHSSKTLTHDVQRDANGRILPKHQPNADPQRPRRSTVRVVDL